MTGENISNRPEYRSNNLSEVVDKLQSYRKMLEQPLDEGESLEDRQVAAGRIYAQLLSDYDEHTLNQAHWLVF